MSPLRVWIEDLITVQTQRNWSMLCVGWYAKDRLHRFCLDLWSDIARLFRFVHFDFHTEDTFLMTKADSFIYLTGPSRGDFILRGLSVGPSILQQLQIDVSHKVYAHMRDLVQSLPSSLRSLRFGCELLKPRHLTKILSFQRTYASHDLANGWARKVKP